MIESIRARLAQIPDFEVKPCFYQAGTSTAGRVIFIEPDDSVGEIKSGQNSAYIETTKIRIVIGVPSKSNPNAPQEIIDAVRQVRSAFFKDERFPDKVTWMECTGFREFESCKFIRPEANETKALAMMLIEIKQRVSI